MSGPFADFHFLRPLWLLALLALPLLWYALRRGEGDGQTWRGVVDAHLLPHLLERVAAERGRAPHALLGIAWILACIALAGPAWERLPQPLFQNRAARVIALELSSSMLAQDVRPSRVERARYKIADILRRSGDALPRPLARHLQPCRLPQPVCPAGAHAMAVAVEENADAPIAVARILRR